MASAKLTRVRPGPLPLDFTLIIDDVSADGTKRGTSWKHEWFFNHQTWNSKDVEGMALSDDEYRRLGVSIMARLLALNGRAK